MPGLTVTEKQHGRDRIAARIDRAVERIRARHPALFERVRREAHALALASLGLNELHAELEAIQAEEAVLLRRKKRVQRAMLAALRGTSTDEVNDNFSVRHGADLPLPVEAIDAIARRQAAHEEQLLAGDPVGRDVSRLGAEKEGLLDTIWLATSGLQIKQIWTRVAEFLGDAPTELEREALALAPDKEA